MGELAILKLARWQGSYYIRDGVEPETAKAFASIEGNTIYIVTIRANGAISPIER